MSTKFELPFDTCFACFQKSDDNCSCKSRKIYEQGKADALNIDLDTPMHFTPEQKAWIKKYLSINGERQRADGAKEFSEWLQENVFIDTESGVTVVCGKEFTRVVGFLELYAEWQKGTKNESNNIQSATVNEQDDYSCMR